MVLAPAEVDATLCKERLEHRMAAMAAMAAMASCQPCQDKVLQLGSDEFIDLILKDCRTVKNSRL